MRRHFFWLLLLLWSPLLRAQDSVRLHPLTEVTLPLFQQSAMHEDAPFLAANLDAEDQTLIIAGKSSLWVWQLSDKGLKRIRLVNAKDESLIAVARDSNARLYAMSQQAIYVVENQGGGQHKRISLNTAYTEGTRFFMVDQGLLWWGNDKGVHVYDPRFNRLKLDKTGKPLQAKDLIAFDAGARRLWIARHKTIMERDTSETGAKTYIRHKGQDRFIGLFPHADGVLAITAKTVLNLAPDGRMRQALPVEGSRSIIQSWISPSIHAYFYNDGLLDLFQNSSGNLRKFRLPQDARGPFLFMQVSAAYIAIIDAQNEARVFHLGS